MRIPSSFRLVSLILLLSCVWPLSAAAQSSATLPDAPDSDSSSGEETKPASSVVPPPQAEEVPLREAPQDESAAPQTPPPSSEASTSSGTNQETPRFAELHGETRVKRDYRAMSDDELRDAYRGTSTGGPTAMAVVGGVILSGAGPLFLIGGIAGISCAANNLPCYGIGTFIGVTGGLTAVSGAMLIGGVIWVDHRKDNRRAITNEMARREKQGASSEIRWGLAPRADGAALAIEATF